MSAPRLLDLFCGAGGAAMGYHRAGFEVVGVDIKPQPHYPFELYEVDALRVLTDPAELGWLPMEFDAIHASPPCQAFTDLKDMHNAKKHEDLLTPTRELLKQTGLPYVIENVEGAKKAMRNPVMLCGTGFSLGVWYGRYFELRRHRLFETNWPLLSPGCLHRGDGTIGIYGDHARFERRYTGPDSQANAKDSLRVGSDAMEIHWMTWDELVESIPPAYTEYIGCELIAQLERGQLAA